MFQGCIALTQTVQVALPHAVYSKQPQRSCLLTCHEHPELDPRRGQDPASAASPGPARCRCLPAGEAIQAISWRCSAYAW